MNRVVGRHQGQIRIITVADIYAIEAWDNYVKIHTAGGVFVKKQTPGWYESALDPADFLRVHRSFIVRIPAISAINPGTNDTWSLRLANGMQVPASRNGYQKLKQQMKI